MTTTAAKTLTVNGVPVEIQGERNLLEVIRKTGIELPTFCYHSDLSVYGACRLCLVEVEKRGIMAACSTPPENGMVVHTDTKQLREIRKINIELLLANHNRECPSCVRSASCTLQNLARRLGVETIRYKQLKDLEPIDKSSPSLERDPNKCVLCGDCVRMCAEVQGIGAIGFAFRGSKAKVVPAFDKGLNEVECINCGQCAAVCPTGAIIPHQNREDVWNAIHDPDKIVVAQVAPAVRFALAEFFDQSAGQNVAGKLVSALRKMGFDYIYDTTFAADMTIWEEAEEFLRRVKAGGPFPMFTSCCPGWVKYAEINFPSLSRNLSSCRSPQQMFGSAMKEALPQMLGKSRKDIVVVSIMPCTAKKFEAGLDKFKVDGNPDVDFVLTTTEIGRMIDSFGIKFNELEPDAFDMPFGFGTGAGVIFGTSGGVMEAALRYAVGKINGEIPMHGLEFKQVRGSQRFKETTVKAGDVELKIAVVNTLGAAREIAKEAAEGKSPYHFVEVMACPGGCVCGGGQPLQNDRVKRSLRMEATYKCDKNMQFKNSLENHMLADCYQKYLGGHPNSEKAHHLLHTVYENRNGVFDAIEVVEAGKASRKVAVSVCVTPGTDEAVSAKALAEILDFAEKKGIADKLVIETAFSPSSTRRKAGEVMVGGRFFQTSELENAKKEMLQATAE